MLNRPLSQIVVLKPNFARLSKQIALGLVLLILLSTYQPAFKLPPVTQSVAVAEQLEQTQAIDAGSLPIGFQLPHPGYLSTPFSNYHPGIDVASGLGMPMKPIAGGKVITSGFDIWGLGLMIEIDHGYGYRSIYAHLGKLYVKKDQEVKETELIGEVGLTGHTSGPHTHIEVSKDGKKINPLAILPPIRKMPIAEDFQATGSAKLTVKK